MSEMFSNIRQAKKEIKDFFEENDGKILDFVDLCERFYEKFSLETIVIACEELNSEGKIKEV